MEALTKEIVLSKIEDIKNSTGDDESAHCMEDDLFYLFVENIKAGNYETKNEIEEIATELYKVREIEFCRWHA